SAEATYDSRYDRWNRKEYTLGCELDLGNDSGLDFSLARQIEPKNPVKRVNAFGVTWTIGVTLWGGDDSEPEILQGVSDKRVDVVTTLYRRRDRQIIGANTVTSFGTGPRGEEETVAQAAFV